MLEEYMVNNILYMAFNEKASIDDLIISSEGSEEPKVYKVYSVVNGIVIVRSAENEQKCISKYRVLRQMGKMRQKCENCRYARKSANKELVFNIYRYKQRLKKEVYRGHRIKRLCQGTGYANHRPYFKDNGDKDKKQEKAMGNVILIPKNKACIKHEVIKNKDR